jgi:hypothetical protein
LVEHALLDHVVRAPQHRRRDREPERLRGLQIDDQLELRWLFDGEVGRLGASENLVHVDCGAPLEPPDVRPIGQETIGIGKFSEVINCGQASLRCKICELSSMENVHRAGQYEQPPVS